MNSFITLLSVVHLVVAAVLILVVIIQDGKGGGFGSSFGGGSQTLFGAGGSANILVKITRVLAVVFMVSCITLAVMVSTGSKKSVVDELPALPAAAPVNPQAPSDAKAQPAAPEAKPQPAQQPGAERKNR